jgi:predicted nucleic-acid-binding protein
MRPSGVGGATGERTGHVEKDHLLPAFEEYRRGPGDFADYYLGRRHRQAGAEHTLTFDQHLKSSSHFHVLKA